MLQQEDYDKDSIVNLKVLKNQITPVMLGESVLADKALYDGYEAKPNIVQWLAENRPQDFLVPGHPSCISAELRYVFKNLN